MSSTLQRDSIDAFAPLREAVSCFMEGGIVGPERALFMFGIRPENVHVSATGNIPTIRDGHQA